jgi:hypothetical protein
MDHANVWKKLIRKIWVSTAHSTDDAILRIITKAKTLLKKLSTLLAEKWEKPVPKSVDVSMLA